MILTNTQKIAGALRTTPLFASMSDAELQPVEGHAVLKSYGAGELLFSEGDPPKGLFVIVSGQIRIFKMSKSGREHVLAIEGPGSSIAELPVFDGGSLPASALSIGNTEVIFLSRQDFHAVCLEYPEVALKVLQVVGSRLRRLVGIIEELSFTTLRQRLVSWLLREVKARGVESARGVVLDLGATHQEIAAQIGTVRELVSRNVARLQAQGLIESSGHQITILDKAALEAELASEL